MANISINAQQLETTLQNTLGEANLNIDLSIAAQWNNAEFTTSKTIALPEDLYLMSKYSEDMRSLRDAYFADTSIQKDNNAYYLFVVPGFDDPAVDGYMVKGKALGFVIGTDYNTYAHELGHGMGALDHAWKSNGPSQGSTSNLMDYAHDADNLTKAQWKELRDVDFVPTMWDDVEDAMYMWDEYISFFNDHKEWLVVPESKKTSAFFLMNGKPYKFDQTGNERISQVMFDKFGRVFAFQTEDLTVYEAVITLLTTTDQPVCRGYLPHSELDNFWNLTSAENTFVTQEQVDFIDSVGYQFGFPSNFDSTYSRSVLYIHNGEYGANSHIEKYENCQADRMIAVNQAPDRMLSELPLLRLPKGFDNVNYTIIQGDSSCIIPNAVFTMNQGCGAQIYYQLKDVAPNQNDLIALADYFSVNGDEFARINSNNDLVLTHSSGEWPPPGDYLSQSYIDAHLDFFKGKSSCLSFQKSMNQYGQIGRDDGLFILTKSEMDDLLNKTN